MVRTRFNCRPAPLALARHDGGKYHGPPNRTAGAFSEDDDEERFGWLSRLRKLLLAACGGCEHSLHLLQRLTDGEITFREYAAMLNGKNAGAAWRNLQATRRELGQSILVGLTATTSIAQGEKGFTLHPQTLEFITSVDMWAVGLGGLGRRYPKPPDLYEVIRFSADRKQYLFGRTQLYLGGWIDNATGEYSLGLSRLLPGRTLAQAIRFARSIKERPLTNLQTGQTIWLDDEEERRAA